MSGVGKWFGISAMHRWRFGPGVAMPLALAALLLGPADRAQGQVERPVYVDDSPAAAEGMGRARELAAIGNLDEAARVFQQLLETEGARLLLREEDDSRYVPVRVLVHEVLLDEPALLERYRALMGPRAADLLESSKVEEVVSSYLLTTAGFEAAMRIAQRRLEAAQFEAAWLAILELENHPDRRGQRGVEAALLLQLISSYVGAESDAEISRWLRRTASRDAARWRTQVGLERFVPERAAMPPIELPRTPLERGEPIDLAGLVPGPPWTRSLGPMPSLDPQSFSPRDEGAIPEAARLLYPMATTWRDMVFTTNGRTVSAWNRFTLDPIWTMQEPRATSRPSRPGPQRFINEPVVVAVGRGLVVGLSGLGMQSSRQPINRRVFARDAGTGELVWSVRVEDVVSDLAGSMVFSGPPVIDQGIVVVGIDKDDPQRRLDGALLAGIDLRDGTARWVRPIGSSGAVTYQSAGGGSQGLRAAGGVIYSGHRIGFVYAIETVSGRVRWIRRERPHAIGSRSSRHAWEVGSPVFTDGELFTITPDRSAILRLDAGTGEVRARLASQPFSEPSYLLRVADQIVGVSQSGLYGIAIDEFENGASARHLGSLEGERIHGRVVATRDRLLVPGIRDGRLSLLVFDPTDDNLLPSQRIELESPGNILPLSSELLVVDDRSIHAYLVWDIAERMLLERIEADPSNPMHPITFAELAFRAGRLGRVIELIDVALDAVDRAPLAASSEEALARLFEAITRMLDENSQHAVRARPDLPMRGQLIARLGRCATSSPQRSTFLLLTASHLQRTGDPAGAVERYQQVLDEPALALSTIQRGPSRVIAENEVRLRLTLLIQQHGRDIYEPYDLEARRQLEMLEQELDPDPFEAIARRYPVSGAAVESLALAARRYEQQGQIRQAAEALNRAIRTSRVSLSDTDPLRGEITGRYVLYLMRANQHRLALDEIERFTEDTPTLELTDDGLILDRAAMIQQLTEAMRREGRRPRIGSHAIGSRELTGWTIEPTLSTTNRRAVTDRIMLRSDKEPFALSLWQLGDDNRLKQKWTAPANEILLWIDARGVVMMEERGEQGLRDPSILLRDTETGQIVWRTSFFREHFAGSRTNQLLEEAGAIVPRIELPNPDGSGSDPFVTQIRGEFDDHTLVLADRLGRLVAIDLDSGAVLWKLVSTVPRLYDLDVEQGTVVLGGSDAPLDLEQMMRGRAARAVHGDSVVVALDARRGELIRSQDLRGNLRWVRLAPESVAVVGMEDRVLTSGLYLDTEGWSSDLEQLRSTTQAWPVPGRVLIRTKGGTGLVQIETEAGPGLVELETQGRLEQGFGQIRVDPLGDHVAILTANGMALYDRAGALVGLDEQEHRTPMLTGGASDRFIPALTRSRRQEPGPLTRFDLVCYTTESLRAASHVVIEVGAEPHTMALLDGKVLVSSGAVTTVIDMPPDDVEAPEP